MLSCGVFRFGEIPSFGEIGEGPIYHHVKMTMILKTLSLQNE